jgi:hypothetical protein
MRTNRHARISKTDERPAQTDENHVQTNLRSFGFLPASQLRMDDLREHGGRE